MNEKSPFKSTTLWGIFVAWIGLRLNQALAPYDIPPETIEGITQTLTDLGLMLAVIGRTIASKRLRL